MIARIYGWKFLIVSDHFSKFSGHRPCGSRVITHLIFHVILKDHVIKGACQFLKGSSSVYIPTLPSLVALGIVVVDI